MSIISQFDLTFLYYNFFLLSRSLKDDFNSVVAKCPGKFLPHISASYFLFYNLTDFFHVFNQLNKTLYHSGENQLGVRIVQCWLVHIGMSLFYYTHRTHRESLFPFSQDKMFCNISQLQLNCMMSTFLSPIWKRNNL